MSAASSCQSLPGSVSPLLLLLLLLSLATTTAFSMKASATSEETSGEQDDQQQQQPAHLNIHSKLADYLQQLQTNDFFIMTDDDGQPIRNASWSDYWDLVADSRKRLLATEIAESLQLANDAYLDDDEMNQVITWPGVRAQLAEVANFNEHSLKTLPGGAGNWLSAPAASSAVPSAGQETELIIARFEGAKPASDLINAKNDSSFAVPLWRYTYNLDLIQRDCPVAEATLHLTIRGVDLEQLQQSLSANAPSIEDVEGGDSVIANARRRRAHKHHGNRRAQIQKQYEQAVAEQAEQEVRSKMVVEIGTQFYSIYDAPITAETYDLEVPITDLVRLWASSPRHWRSGHQIVFTSPLMPGMALPVAVVESNATQTKEGPYVEVKYSQTNCRRSFTASSGRPRRGVPTVATPNVGGNSGSRAALSTNGAASFSASMPSSSFLSSATGARNQAAANPSPDCSARVNKVAGHTMCCRKEITIDFHALGHKSVLTPRVLKGHVCVGRCLMPFVRGSNRGDFQEALAKASGEEPCCVPVARTGSIRFLLYNKTGHVFTRDLNNFYLQDCECRI